MEEITARELTTAFGANPFPYKQELENKHGLR
jgi:hypothetical protein